MISPAVVCDLDSTLCDTSPRHHLQPSGPARKTNAGWVDYSLACWMDHPIASTIALLCIAQKAGLRVILLSARSAQAEHATRAWLAEHDVPYHDLVLRGDDEEDDPGQFKIDSLRSLQDLYDVQLLIDDYDVTCRRAWDELGIPALHVHQPTHYSESLLGMPL